MQKYPFKAAAIFAALAILLACVTQAEAGPSYRKPTTSNPASDSWRYGPSIFLGIDQAACQKAYGKNWPQECASPALGEPGSIATGVEMTPSAPGHWVWEGTERLRFQPEAPLKANTRYQISIKRLPLSPRIKLSRDQLVYQTQPQAVMFGNPQTWIDPSPKGAHAVSFPMEFIWPVNPQEMERRISVAPDLPSAGLRLGEPKFVWNEGRDGVVVNVPVLRAAADRQSGTLSIQGMGSCAYNQGVRQMLGGASNAKSRFSFAGTSQMMKVERISLLKERDDDLNNRYTVELKASLRLKPSQLLAKTRLIELPEKMEPGAKEPTNWERIPALSKDDENKGRTVQATLLVPDAPTDLVRFSVPIKDGRCLAVFVDEMVSEGGLHAGQRYLYILRAPKIGSSIGFLQPGNILSLNGEKKIDLCATGVDKVEWKAKRIRDPFLAMMAKFRSFNQRETIEECGEGPDIDAMSQSVSGTIQISKAPEGEASFPVLDLAPLLANGGNGLMQLELKASLKGKEVASASRLVLVSDLGLTVKTAADGSSSVFVQSISSGKPVSGATIRILGANGLPVVEGQSNADGMARLASVNGLSGESKPAAVVGTSGKDIAWLSLADTSRKLDTSDLATSGRHCQKDGLIASVFSQRGLYMPGETLHFGCIVRRFDWAKLPGDLPLEARITSPTGQTVMKQAIAPGKDGLLSLSWPSPQDCPTGAYRLEVALAGAGGDSVIGETSVRVEEFEPDTLEMQAKMVPVPSKGWIVAREGGIPVEVKAGLQTLYGDAASGHRLKVTFQTTPARLSFKGFEDYTFYDPTPEISENKETELPEQFTVDGGASFFLPLSGFAGTFRGNVRIEAFEAAGGRAVTRQISALFSPVPLLVGYKPQQEAGNLSFLPKGSKASVRLIAVNSELERIDLPAAKLTISHRRYVNALVSDTMGRYRYDSTPVDLPISKSDLSISKEGTNVTLPTSAPGDYLLSLSGSKGEQLALIPFSVTGNGLLAPENGDAASLAKPELRLKLPKENFAPGETISFQITAPYEGTGLVTIERDEVAASAWFSASPGENVKSITIPKNFEGKGYLCVSFRRSAASDNIYLSPHVHAVAPFNCGVGQRNMGLSVSTPQSVLPGTPLKVKIKSKTAGRALVFAVDEGVLSLTGFRTPDPLKDLLCDRALDVTTRQAFDLLMPEHARLKGRIPAFGGGMAGGGGRFINPFRRRSEPPFALWQGIVETGPTETEISVPVPEYLSGRIRVMAVGSSSDSGGASLLAGSAQCSATVKGTVILRPALPLAVAPGDVFEGAVTVANTVEGSGKACKISLSIAPDSAFRLVNSVDQKEIEVDENGQFTVPFKVKVQNILGPANLRFTAKIQGNSKASTRTQSVSVRPLSKSVRVDDAGPVDTGGVVDVGRSLYPYKAKTRLFVAPAPVSGFAATVDRLEEYPYGCTEQLVSKAFPYAAAGANKALRQSLGNDGSAVQKRSGERIGAALSAIAACDTGYGISLWNGGGADDFVTVYAADFLLTLSENASGTAQSYGSIADKLESILAGEPLSLHDARTKAYAGWVLLRMGELTQGVDRLESWLQSYASPAWRSDITAALIADCKRMQRRISQAQDLKPEKLTFEGYSQPGSQMFTIGVAKALFLAVNANLDCATNAMVDDALDVAFSTRATTAEMGLAARGLAKLGVPSNASGQVRISCEKYQEGFDAGLERQGDLFLEAPGCERFSVDTNGKKIPTLYWHASSEGFERKPLAKSSSGLRLSRRYLNSKGEPVTQARIGDVLTVELSLAAGKDISNAALVDLLPGGLEPVMEQPDQSAAGIIRFERREDRGIFFVNLTNETRTFRYKVRAVTAGSFLMPQCYAEAMYNPSINASDGEGFFSVLK